MSTETMVIKGSSVIERSKDVSGEIKLSHYLQVDTSFGIRSRIPFDEYREIYEKSIGENKPVMQGIDIGDPEQLGQSVGFASAGNDLNPVLGLLLQKLDVPSGDNLTSNQELFIQSELAEFLELPWESVVDKTYVFREVIHAEDIVENNNAKNGFLVMMSHAHLPNKNNIGNDLNEEVVDMFDQITKNNKDSFKIDEMFFLKHSTRTTVTETKWEKFKYLHIVLHGEEDGRLCLENAMYYDQIDYLTKDEFVSLLNAESRPHFVLIFLSFCFSGGGAEQASLAFDLVRTGVTENVIAYTGGVGSPSAKKFSKIFYNFLTCGDLPRLAFQKAMDKYKSENQNPEYLPMFFTRKSV